MSVSVNLNGTTFTIPTDGETNWGPVVTSFFQAIANGTLQKTGGNFSLSNEVNTGATYGFKVPYIKSQAANPASSGVVRLGSGDTIKFRNATNTGDIAIGINASGQLTVDGVALTPSGSVTDADISPAAAIALSKLAAVTASRALVSDGSGIISPSAVTATELSYVSGVTSGIQAQIDSKASTASFTAHTGAATGVHGTTGDVVGTTDTQTLTNKTLTAPVINNATADTITGASGGALALTGASNQNVNLTASGTGLVDVNGVQVNGSNQVISTKDADLEIRAKTGYNTKINAFTGNVLLQSANTTQATVKSTGIELAAGKTLSLSGGGALVPPSSGTMTVPAGTDTLVGKNTTDTLTNKTLTAPVVDALSMTNQGSAPATPSAGTTKIYVKSADGKAYILNSSGTETAVGSGSGGGVNLISNPDAETDTSNVSTYKDTASATPTTGTGGSPTLTLTRSTTSPINGTASFLLTKPASNCLGEGAAFACASIAQEYRAKVLQLSFDYMVSSGTFVAGTSTTDSDITVWIKQSNGTTTTITQPSTYKLYASSTSISTTFITNFQTNYDTTSITVLLHCATSNAANSFVLKCDSLKLAPSQYVYGTPITDWQDRGVISISGSTSNPTKPATSVDKMWTRRVGDSMEVRVEYVHNGVAGSAGSGDYLLGLPSGVSIDTSKVTADSAVEGGSSDYTNNNVVGKASLGANGANVEGGVLVHDSTKLRITGIWSNGTSHNRGAWGSSFFNLAEGTLFMTAQFSVPILGWSSSVQTSDQADSRVVAARYQLSAAQSIPNSTATDIIWNAKTYDTHSAMNTTTGVYTFPVAGYYRFTVGQRWASNATGIRYVSAVITGASSSNAPVLNVFSTNNDLVTNSASDMLYFNAGDTIKIQGWQNSGGALQFQPNGIAYFALERLSQASLMSATETTSMRYTSTNTPTVGTFPTDSMIAFNTKTWDTHGLYSGSTFTAQSQGRYRVTCKMSLTTPRTATSAFLNVNLYKNGSLYSELFTSYGNGSTQSRMSGSDEVQLNAGETLQIGAQADAASQTVASGAYLVITRIGN